MSAVSPCIHFKAQLTFSVLHGRVASCPTCLVVETMGRLVRNRRICVRLMLGQKKHRFKRNAQIKQTSVSVAQFGRLVQKEGQPSPAKAERSFAFKCTSTGCKLDV
ncbi:unnamed protein product [Durusdinium trenchii]|uniref:50S ribosomal protein L28 n=1 Tax=Durusdinium trenchii TaxID=1381693 RepID=A0ABP0LBR8_9DINO